MISSSIFWALSALLVQANAEAADDGFHERVAARQAQAPSEITVTDNVVSLNSMMSSGFHSAALSSAPPDHYPTTSHVFAVEITFNHKTFFAIVDTGSADTWLVESGFTCLDVETRKKTSQEACAFGPAYTPDDTFKQIPDVNFNVTYADRELITGIFGNQSVTLAGIDVEATVALVNLAAWNGDGTTSGLIGLAYPSLTYQFMGTDPSKDGTTGHKHIEYNPIFQTMIADGLIKPYFSLVVTRNTKNEGPAGYLAFGGVPPNVKFNPDFAHAPILPYDFDKNGKACYEYYLINIDSVQANGKSYPAAGGSKIKYIVDLGTTLNHFPVAVADAIAALYDPPAKYNDNEGQYDVDCKAKAPSMSVTINGHQFVINPADMIVYIGDEGDTPNECIAGFTQGNPDDDFQILGAQFLKNVVAVFDVGANIMQFAALQ